MNSTARFLLAFAAIAIVGVGAYRYITSPNVVNQTATLPNFYLPLPIAADSLCPDSDTATVNMRGLDTGAIHFARANGYFNWCVPEYDDDQAFADGKPASAAYGSVAHVLAVPVLGQLVRDEQFDGLYVQVAIIDVEEPVTRELVPYSGLGLTAHNCMYLQHHSKAYGIFEHYSAVIVPAAHDLTCPTKPLEAASQRLEVAVDDDYSTQLSDYPPTTRFVEGEKGRTLIGVKCAKHWCVVAPQGYAKIPPSAHNNVLALKATMQGKIKGWFDDQVLGEPATTGITRKYRASAIPDANLGNLKVANFTGGYVVVGKVWFQEEPAKESKYATVYGFSKDTNIVALKAVASSVGGKLDWYAEVTNARGEKKTIPTHRTDHSQYFLSTSNTFGGLPPAVFRWRWNAKDEDLWVECDAGCCLVGHS